MATARILVVDDEPAMLEATSRLLRRQGYEVISAARPLQALEIVRDSAPIDVVVADIKMPEMDGTQLVREVAQVSPQTAGLLMTGGASKPSDVPDDVLVLRKPFSTKDLIAAVEATVTRSAELSADLRRHSEKTVQLRQQSEQLQSEAVKTVQETSEILNISRQTRKNWSS